MVRFLIEAKRADVLKTLSDNGEGQETIGSASLVFDALPGSGGSPFRRIRDVAEIEQEIALAAEARKKENKGSFWSKANPVNWFRKESDDKDYSETFSDEEDATRDASQE